METRKRYIYQSVIEFAAKCIFIVPLAVFSHMSTAQALPPSIDVQSELITIESGGPDYLNPVSNTADLNLLAGIFGNIARAAAGQIDLATLAVGDPNSGESTADNILSSIMSVYLTGILAITGIIIVILIGLMTIQSGQEGSVLTKRYNEWVAIRTLYAVFAMMPVIGGWSIGQYAILSGTFFVNTMTNEMNHVASRWVFANGTTNSIDLDPFVYRSIIETVYLNEVCAQINNKTINDFSVLQDTHIQQLIDRIATGNLSESTHAGLSKGIDWLTLRSSQFGLPNNTINASAIPTNSDLFISYKWGAPALGESVCGEITIDFTSFETPNVAVNNSRLLPYFQAQSSAMASIIAEVKNEVGAVLTMVSNINQEVPVTDKELREQRINTEAVNNSHFAAFAFAFDPISKHNVSALDKVLAEKVIMYRNLVSSNYRALNRDNAELFDELLNDIAIKQRNGGTADYGSVYEEVTDTIDSKYSAIAGPEIKSLLANTSRGWVFSGYKWWDLSKAQTTQIALQGHHPTALPYRNFLTGVSDITRENIDRFTTIYVQGRDSRRFVDHHMEIDGVIVKPQPNTVDAAESFSAMANAKEAVKSFNLELGPWVTKSLTSIFLQDFESTDLLTNLQSAGHKYLWIGEGLYLTSAALSVMSETAKTGGGWAVKTLSLGSSDVIGSTTSAILKEIAKPLSMLAALFIMVGFLYAVYLPLLPAMIWTFAIIGWLEKLISLIIIFPIWMLGHVFPDGDGIVNGIGRQGYVLTANVLLRPPVQLLALHFAMAALGGIGFLLSHIIEVFLPSANSGYTTGLIIGLGSFIVMSGFIVVICHMILSWIYKIPDEIPHYIGGGASNFGESEGKGQIHSIAGVVSNQTQSGVTSLTGKEKPDGENHGKRLKQNNKLGSMGV